MDYTKDALLIEEIIKSHEDVLLHSNHSQGSVDVEGLYESSGPPSINYTDSDEYDDWNDTMGYIPYSMRPETYIVPMLFAIIFVIGVLGNGTLIAIFIKHRTMRNVPNMYIVSLATGDLLVIFFAVPFTSTVYTLESWPYGEFVCKFSEFVKDMSIGISVFTLTALSADRYFAIVDPMRKLHGRRATRITCITIAGIWVLSIAMALPSALFSYVRAIDQDPSRIFYVCYPFPPELGDNYPQVMVMFHFLAYYAIPLAFIGTFYIIMARHLVLSTRNMPGEAQGQGGGQAKQIQARKKVAKMILSFVVIFAICFFPSHLFLLWFYYYPDSENHFSAFWNACRITGFCLTFINSCINPITLYCVSGTFRKQFNEHLFCCICDAEGRSRSSRRRAGFGCGCVSLSSAGPVFGGDYRYRNGHTYTGGRGLHRGSTTNSTNTTTKRKSTWDTQSTMSHHPMYNLTNTNANTNQNHNQPLIKNGGGLSYNNGDPQGSSQATEVKQHSNSNNINNLNNRFPLTHHPYQKDYLNRINALEKGDPPPPLFKAIRSNVTEGHGNGRRKSSKILESQSTLDEFTVTSFINLPGVCDDEDCSIVGGAIGTTPHDKSDMLPSITKQTPNSNYD